MPSRNAKTRPVSWKRSCNEQLADAIKEAQQTSHKLGWIVDATHLGILTSRDNLGRMEGSKYQLRDWFFPHFDNITPDEVEEALKILHKYGLIIRYQHKGLWYIQLPKVGKWSDLRGNNSEMSDFPAPSDEIIDEWEHKFNDVYTLCERRIYEVSPERERERERERESKRESKRESDNLYVEFENSTLQGWNTLALAHPILSRIEKIGETRRKHLKQRFESAHFRDNFSSVLEAIPSYRFLLGDNKSGWKISFDWLIVNDNNYLKVLEGRYKDRDDSQEGIKKFLRKE